MNQIIKEVIEKVYVKHDFEFFIFSCAKKIKFIDELLEKLRANPGHASNRGFGNSAFPDTWTDDYAIKAV